MGNNLVQRKTTPTLNFSACLIQHPTDGILGTKQELAVIVIRTFSLCRIYSVGGVHLLYVLIFVIGFGFSYPQEIFWHLHLCRARHPHNTC